MIEARHITKRYGDRVILDGADISVGGGQAVVLTGDNGSGKTTLLHVLVGLRRPDAGEVVWKGHLLTGAGNTAWRGARSANSTPWDARRSWPGARPAIPT